VSAMAPASRISRRHFFPIRALIDSDLPSRRHIEADFDLSGFTPVAHGVVTQVTAPDWRSFVEKSALHQLVLGTAMRNFALEVILLCEGGVSRPHPPCRCLTRSKTACKARRPVLRSHCAREWTVIRQSFAAPWMGCYDRGMGCRGDDRPG